MKRISLFVAVATFAIFSCVKTSEVNNGDYNYDPTIISFGTRVIGTKANDKSSTWAGLEEIGMFAHTTDAGAFVNASFTSGFMNNVKVTNSTAGTGTWAIDVSSNSGEKYYWPTNSISTLTFFAYHPYDNVNPPTIEAGGLIEIPWAVEAIAAAQKDLLYSNVLSASSMNRSGVGVVQTTGATKFEFTHALSKISFKAKLKEEIESSDPQKNKKRIFIESIKINNVYGAGTMVFNNDLEPRNAASPPYSPSAWDYNSLTPAETQVNNFTSYEASVTDLISGLNEVNYHVSDYAYIGTDDKTNSLLMIPQLFTNTTSIELSYKIGASGDSDPSTDAPLGDLQKWTYILNSETHTAWEANNHYVYTFNIAPGTGEIDAPKHEIEFGYTVDDWNAAPDLIIPIPELPVANSYIIKPGSGGTPTEVKIPVVKRINQFWADAANGGVQDDKPSVSSNGRGYIIDATNTKFITNTDLWNAAIIWSDIDYAGKITLTGGEANNEFLTVSVADGTDAGNAVIGVYDGTSQTDLLWSWHLWITDYAPESTVIEPSGATGTVEMKSNLIAMDRNLGAINNTFNDVGSLGLLYQWGRKDPFLGANALTGNAFKAVASGTGQTNADNGSLILSIANPTIFYKTPVGKLDWITESGALYGATGYNRWGGATAHDDGAVPFSSPLAISEKSIYDPCPSGWRVPTSVGSRLWAGTGYGVSATVPFIMWNTVSSNGSNLSTFSGRSVWFPAFGYINSGDGTLADNAVQGLFWGGPSSNDSDISICNGYYLKIFTSATSADFSISTNINRGTGCSVRPVLDTKYALLP